MPLESKIKRSIRSAVRCLLGDEIAWGIIGAMASSSAYLRVQRRAATETKFQNKCDRLFALGTVLSGPFVGLRYPFSTAYGSAFYPKLLGTYESELHDGLGQFCGRSYDGIVDIGFAEGYYLVGLGRLLPMAEVWGFDISPEAHSLCQGLAEANGIAPSRLRLHEHAKPALLRNALKGRTLVVCDCEGFEVELFAPGNEALWQQADLIVECHDFIHPGATAAVRKILEATHEITMVASVDSAFKTQLVPPSIRARFSTGELVRLVSEGRPALQQWIVAAAKGC
jgi:hypothetical protein